MKKKLIDILESRGYKAYLQGSFTADEMLPESFWTFWNFDTPAGMHYDNAAHRALWSYWIYFYSVDPETVETEIKETIKLLKDNGITVDGFGQDADSGVQTHTGRMLTVYIPEYLEE